MARLREALIIAKRLWTEPEVTFKGRFYELTNAYLEPKPIQKPHIPIWVPGDLEATRNLAAELADCWLIYSKPPEVVERWAQDMRERSGRHIPIAVSTVSLGGLTRIKRPNGVTYMPRSGSIGLRFRQPLRMS